MKRFSEINKVKICKTYFETDLELKLFLESLFAKSDKTYQIVCDTDEAMRVREILKELGKKAAVFVDPVFIGREIKPTKILLHPHLQQALMKCLVNRVLQKNSL